MSPCRRHHRIDRPRRDAVADSARSYDYEPVLFRCRSRRPSPAHGYGESSISGACIRSARWLQRCCCIRMAEDATHQRLMPLTPGMRRTAVTIGTWIDELRVRGRQRTSSTRAGSPTASDLDNEADNGAESCCAVAQLRADHALTAVDRLQASSSPSIQSAAGSPPDPAAISDDEPAGSRGTDHRGGYLPGVRPTGSMPETSDTTSPREPGTVGGWQQRCYPRRRGTAAHHLRGRPRDGAQATCGSSSCLPSYARSRGPRVVQREGEASTSPAATTAFERNDPDGQWCDLWLFEDSVTFPPACCTAPRAMPREEQRNVAARYEDLRPGTYMTRSARLADMDLKPCGGGASTSRTSFPSFCGQGFLERDDKALAAGVPAASTTTG